MSRSHLSPSPANSVLNRRHVASRLTLVKPPKNLQAIASQKTRQPLAFRGVYPYLPMATNAPWSILGGMKNQFWGDEKV